MHKKLKSQNTPLRINTSADSFLCTFRDHIDNLSILNIFFGLQKNIIWKCLDEWHISFFTIEKGNRVINDSNQYKFLVIKIILQLPWQLKC